MGADYLLLGPQYSAWALDEAYQGLAEHVSSVYPRLAVDGSAGALFALRQRVDEANREDSAQAPHGQQGSLGRRAACTIISRNYLSHARVLARSFLRHEPDARFYVLIVDGLPDGVDFGPDVTVVGIDEIGLDATDVYEMCFKYDVVEFATAVKPSLLSAVLHIFDEPNVVYLDPDILVTAPLSAVWNAFDEATVVVTPHILTPIPDDGKSPSEREILISGAFNLGFIGVRRCAEVDQFLGWWAARLAEGCRIDVANGLFTDQKWIDLAPGMFAGLRILRDASCNVAFWNLHERVLSRQGADFLVNGRPLTFAHISGFNPHTRRVLSKHQTRIHVEEGSALADLLDLYADLQLLNEFDTTSSWGYGFAEFDDGTPINAVMRKLYLSLDREQRREFGNPFTTRGEETYRDWALRPRADYAGLSPFLEALYRVRFDVAAVFPDIRGRDRDAFLQWAREQGAAEMNFAPEFVVAPDPSILSRSSQTPGAFPPDVRDGSVQRPLPYQDLVARMRDVLRAALPPGACAVVITKGDEQLLAVEGYRLGHYPQAADGTYAGFYPPSSDAAIGHLRLLQRNGVRHIVFPEFATWWLQHPTYAGFADYVTSTAIAVIEEPGVCSIYSFPEPAIDAAGTAERTRVPVRATPRSAAAHATTSSSWIARARRTVSWRP